MVVPVMTPCSQVPDSVLGLIHILSDAAIRAVAAEQKYDLGGGGGGVRGCEAAVYQHEVSVCECQKLGGLKPP